ncbi:CotS family spore coat protein [Clostridium fallax]|uniref:Spore coat protein, CotS family n=1 Tax=Clostridium fallax TaxID=1533 RepID=A0A1M4YP57_9CLOT|nr:CotS family spore coat protein [Clostridium fallax]SHF07585.1 spore coat protein, CotS family [Clostridium fallax]SQB07526.1 spore coat protein, CotS family [Clostridium fallax]
MLRTEKKAKNYFLSESNLIKHILSEYNLIDPKLEQIKIKNSDKPRAVYKVISKDNKTYCLKKVYYNKEQLLFVYSALEWIDKNGLNVPKFLPTKKGSRYVSYNNMLFILTPWIDGVKCDYDNIEHIKNISKTLAHLHKVTKKFTPIKGSLVKQGYENIYISINKHFNRLLSCNNLAFNNDDKFSKLFISTFDDNISLAQISMNTASLINFNNLTTSLCHGDYVNKNILIDSSSKLWLIDFDKCALDFVAHDISYYLRRLLRRDTTAWDVDLALTCIKNYNSINPLTIDDLRYIIAYLSFPQKYWKISKDYYNNISKCNKNSFYNLLSKTTEKTEFQIKFIKSFSKRLEETFLFKIC